MINSTCLYIWYLLTNQTFESIHVAGFSNVGPSAMIDSKQFEPQP